MKTKQTSANVYDLHTNAQVGQILLDQQHTQSTGVLGDSYTLHSFQLQQGALHPYWQGQQVVGLKTADAARAARARIAAYPTEADGTGLIKVEQT